MKRLFLPVFLILAASITLTTCKKDDENKVELPTIITLAVTEITDTTAKCGGNVTNNDGGDITSKGIVWSTTQNPTIEQQTGLTGDGVGSGPFQSNLTGLTPNTTYYARAYATNSKGVGYGSQVQFTTETAGSAPEAAFNASPTSGRASLIVNFTDQSTNTPTSWQWSFGDGGSSNEKDPQYTYLIAGTYTVSLTISNSHGSGTETKTNYIDVLANKPPTVTTIVITNITPTTATSGGNVANQGDTPVTQKGVVWNTSPNPTLADSLTNDGTGAGAFSSQLTGLNPETTYYLRAYAINEAGAAYGAEVVFTTQIDHCEGVTPPPGYGVVSSSGKCWLDRNLGASRVATSSTDDQAYGDLYQWGRLTDGHEKRYSALTWIPSSSDIPGHSKFIYTGEQNFPYDWRIPQNDNLWQGVIGINNPCPPGYRLPTETEWEAEIQSFNSNGTAGAFSSPLKLTLAGARYDYYGELYGAGYFGNYWSSSLSTQHAIVLTFRSDRAAISGNYRAFGVSVRCLKD